MSSNIINRFSQIIRTVPIGLFALSLCIAIYTGWHYFFLLSFKMKVLITVLIIWSIQTIAKSGSHESPLAAVLFAVVLIKSCGVSLVIELLRCIIIHDITFSHWLFSMAFFLSIILILFIWCYIDEKRQYNKY